MNTTTMHWAADLIGKPYRKAACGPDAFDCWGLVRYVFEHVHGIAMPHISVGQIDDGSADNVAAIKQAAAVSGWRPSDDGWPAEHDIVLMSGIDGRHVGVMVRDNGPLMLLHSIEPMGVCVQPLGDLPRAGFTGFVFWRRDAA